MDRGLFKFYDDETFGETGIDGEEEEEDEET